MAETTRRCASLALVACLSLPAVTEGARDDVPEEIARRENPATLDEGRELRYYTRHFKAKCARCHGLGGDGGGKEAGQQSLPPRDFTDSSYMRTRTDGQLFYQILKGGGPESSMPAFGPGSDQSWDEDRIWHMVAFVRRFSEGEEK